jgi:hypothetical protein
MITTITITLVEKQTKNAYITDVAVPKTENTEMVYNNKIQKYIKLACEIQRQ